MILSCRPDHSPGFVLCRGVGRGFFVSLLQEIFMILPHKI
jgi:hypothetical protein